MSHFRVTELWCDDCDLRENWEGLVEARANGWTVEKGEDLCRRCAAQRARLALAVARG